MQQLQTIVTRPDLYDWLYEDFYDDIPMYLKISEKHSEILELGVGTGRIAIPLAEQGIDVYGIDNSEDMLSRFRAKLNKYPDELRSRVHLFNKDMRKFELDRTFSLALVPFSSFNYLMEIDEQLDCLQSIKKHLRPNGILALELISYSLFPDWFSSQPTLKKVKEKIDQETNNIIQLWKSGSFDSSSQTIKEERYFKHYSADGELLREDLVIWKNRFFLLGEMNLLLKLSGFKLLSVYGDFDFQPYTH